MNFLFSLGECCIQHSHDLLLACKIQVDDLVVQVICLLVLHFL
jgi:hypothetical protein